MKFVTQADWIPGFWNFLVDLDQQDLVAELVQNDLDQGATETHIDFRSDRVVAHGNGKPVDRTGWQRLSYIHGAGNDVPAKKSKIGVKNHGLKTAFTLGDEVWIQSNGRRMIQTLWAAGRGEAPRPGASREPELDHDAPKSGCRITIPYRKYSVVPEEGEAIELRAPSTDAVDALFREICASVPEQFAGVVSPPAVPEYRIHIGHWRAGEVSFTFRCTQPERARDGIWVFRRQCTVQGDVDETTAGLREEVARKHHRASGRLWDRMADFFRDGKNYFIEVSWPINTRGRPRLGAGRFRYPIGYPAGAEAGLTRRGANFSAPFVSDTERHGPARNDPVNEELRETCEALLAQVLATRLTSKWGPNGLIPLLPPASIEHRENETRAALAYIAKRSAIPSVSRADALRALANGRRGRAENAVRNLESRRAGRAKRRYRFVLPVATWDSSRVHAGLATLCPSQERQVHPAIDGRLVKLLVDGDTDGWGSLYVSFDQWDALAVASASGNEWFEAGPLRERASPVLGRALLDLTAEAIDRKEIDKEDQQTLQRDLLVPNSSGGANPLHEVYRGVSLPEGVPGVALPSTVHPNIAGHRLLNRSGWRPRKYTLTDFLDDEILVEAPDHTRRKFWKWLKANAPSVPAADRRRLARMPVWPDSNGILRTLAELCEPKSRSIIRILGDAISRPSPEVKKCPIVSVGSRKTNAIRRMPTSEELGKWLDEHVGQVTVGQKATGNVEKVIWAMETGLAAMLRDGAVAPVLKTLASVLPTESADGWVRYRNELVSPTPSIRRLALPQRFMARTGRDQDVVDRLCSRLERPTADMLIRAFEEDGWNRGSLHARLREFVDLTEPKDEHRKRLCGLEMIPHQQALYAPKNLAFKSRGPDYWGEWKVKLPTTGLSQNDENRYKDIGVTGAKPNEETSRQFFVWLGGQNGELVGRHLPCVIRHFLLHYGPRSWAQAYTNIPCIPAMSNMKIELVSLGVARKAPVLIDNAHELADEITQRDSKVRFVVGKVQEVKDPVTTVYRDLGIRGLREQVGEPKSVVGLGDQHEAPMDANNALNAIQSRQFRDTFIKRLDELGVDKAAVRNDWQSRVTQIARIRVADEVQATYLYRRKEYSLGVKAGFDLNSQTLWLRRREGASAGHLYEAVAAERVFRLGTQKILLLALAKAVDMDTGDWSYGRPLVPESVLDGDTEGDDASDEGEFDDEVGESTRGHSPFRPDPSRNRPNPVAISTSNQSQGRKGGARKGQVGGDCRSLEQEETPELERLHREELKRSHYASHCQVCLCRHSPEELAPKGSYVEWEEVRSRIVEAHHVDPKAGGGMRNAANLLLLCRYHHDNLGRRLSRELVAGALEKAAKEAKISFGGEMQITGYVVVVSIPDTGDEIPIFFTYEHAKYWLGQS